jgi:hypothetical protein
MTDNEQEGHRTPFFERKVFFLHPPFLIEKMYHDLVHAGFEAYLVYDHNLALELVKEYRNSILYVNIDAGQDDGQWFQYVGSIISNEGTRDTHIGILTDARLNKKDVWAEKYLFDLEVQCGFISYISDLQRVKEVILKILDANEARGRRRYVRAAGGAGCSVNFKVNDDLYVGDIVDISIGGMACILNDQSIRHSEGTVIRDIQLKLRGVISMLSGKIVIVRLDRLNRIVHVVLFDLHQMSKKVEQNIVGYICKCLQEFVEQKALQHQNL